MAESPQSMALVYQRRLGLGSVWRWLSTAAVVGLVAACGGGGSGGTGAPLGSSGSLNVFLTDAPSCGYDNVWVTVEKVRVNLSDSAGDNDSGWTDVTLAAPKRIDLLTLTNGVLEPLGSTSLPAGAYKQIRLVLAANNASSPLANAVKPTGDTERALDTPSAQQSGLKLKANFDVLPGETADIVLDFDACKSVVRAGKSGKYLLKPVISVFKLAQSGITGYVSPALVTAGASVSAQQGGVAVRSTVPAADGKFSLTLLPSGTYTLVVAAEGFQTGVIAGVPVSTGNTTVSLLTSPIVLGTSTMSVASGTVSVGVTPTVATVQASQALSSAGTVTVAQSQPVDGGDGGFSLSLPRLAPKVGVYSATTLPATLSDDTPVAGKYTLTAQALGQAKSAPFDVNAVNPPLVFVFP